MKTVKATVVLTLAAAILLGCGSGGGDVDAANPEKVNVAEATSKQKGASGVKEANGGGLADMTVSPAPAGVKTGPPVGGQR